MNIKYILRRMKNSAKIIAASWGDALDYCKFNYSAANTRESLEAEILRQTHVIEKGMSLESPRKGFGQEKIKVLLLLINEYINKMYVTDSSVPFQNAICVLKEYVKLQKKLEYYNPEIEDNLKKLNQYVTMNLNCGITEIVLDELNTKIHSEYSDFIESRHSCRQFSTRKISLETIRKCIELAQKSPSACNRQPVKVYMSEKSEINRYLEEYIAGNKGFADQCDKYLIITSDMSAYHHDYERNQLYLDAGIFTYGLIQALHYFGIASCILQNGEFKKKDMEIREKLKIVPNNEKIVAFIAVGYYKDKFNVAQSQRKIIDDVLKII